MLGLHAGVPFGLELLELLGHLGPGRPETLCRRQVWPSGP